jgi:hypothetical protein
LVDFDLSSSRDDWTTFLDLTFSTRNVGIRHLNFTTITRTQISIWTLFSSKFNKIIWEFDAKERQAGLAITYHACLLQCRASFHFSFTSFVCLFTSNVDVIPLELHCYSFD